MKLFYTLIFITIAFSSFSQLLGIYEFTGTGSCLPHQNPNITAQPTNGNFSPFSSTGVDCVVTNNVFNNKNWDPSANINLSKYYEFTLSANLGYKLNLDSLIFASRVSSNTCDWYVRSSLDNFAANLYAGQSAATLDTIKEKLNSSFTGILNVTFRFYTSSITDITRTWRVDDVTLKGTITSLSADIIENLKSEFKLYPNPGNEFLTIEMNSNKSVEEVRIYSLNGSFIKTSKESNVINTSELEKGVYFVEISDGSYKETVKWIKN